MDNGDDVNTAYGVGSFENPMYASQPAEVEVGPDVRSAAESAYMDVPVNIQTSGYMDVASNGTNASAAYMDVAPNSSQNAAGYMDVAPNNNQNAAGYVDVAPNSTGFRGDSDDEDV